MSDFLERYSERVLSDGANTGESLKNNTERFIQQKMTDAPTYRRALIHKSKGTPQVESMHVDVRVIKVLRMGSIRNILFRPTEKHRVGNIITFDGEDWLCYDKHGSEYSHIKMTVALINDSLVWQARDRQIKRIPCISTTSPLGSTSKVGDNRIAFNSYHVKLPESQLLIFIEMNEETSKIALDYRFVVGKRVFKVISVDDVTYVDKDYYGVIQLTLEHDLEITSKDDIENGIAYNAQLVAQSEDDEESNGEGEGESWGW